MQKKEKCNKIVPSFLAVSFTRPENCCLGFQTTACLGLRVQQYSLGRAQETAQQIPRFLFVYVNNFPSNNSVRLLYSG